MAKPIVARKNRSRTSTSARIPPRRQWKPELAALAKLNPDVRDMLRIRLIWAQNALMTATIALENRGVQGEISGSLRTHVYFPLRDITEALDGNVVQP